MLVNVPDELMYCPAALTTRHLRPTAMLAYCVRGVLGAAGDDDLAGVERGAVLRLPEGVGQGRRTVTRVDRVGAGGRARVELAARVVGRRREPPVASAGQGDRRQRPGRGRPAGRAQGGRRGRRGRRHGAVGLQVATGVALLERDAHALVTPVSSVAVPARLTVSEPSVGAVNAIVVFGGVVAGVGAR